MLSDAALRVLVVESDLEQVQLLEEAFTELEELRGQGAFVATFGREYALDFEEARAVVESGAFDAVLVSMEGRECEEAYARLQALVPETPFVVLVSSAEERLGVRLLRRGAQEYLIREDIDCMPLGRALRSAIERHGWLRALRSAALTDSLTGLYNRRGFVAAFERDSRLAARLGLALTLTVLEEESGADPQARDLRMLEAADGIRRLQGEALAGRWDESRLVVAQLRREAGESDPLATPGYRTRTALGEPGEGVEALVDRMIHASGGPMCQNRQLESCAGRHL